ncbi:uncharacterized protein LOC129957526 [Argiope bruennichi]|uniref:uncharacterized protein LOC129957526 n=1 Tax=Argiope bruennichi TaxID=94029 RepID=UPI0024947888|nr:uncharacterized protein LOC129957526 [Argiope bruennichi]XP_055925844.1 uncharacterized protein LOC129957526 [Argiope bruennichi]
MELDFRSMSRLPLKDLALRKVAALLCSHPTMHAHAAVVALQLNRDAEVDALCEFFKNAVTTLSLPATISEDLVIVMQSVFKEILKWLVVNREILEPDELNLDNPENLKHIHWTPLGTVEFRETAAALVRHGKLSIMQRYKLACLYCLEDDVRDLWRMIPPRRKGSFYDNSKAWKVGLRKMVVIWTYTIKRQTNDVGSILEFIQERGHFSFNQLAFESAAVQGYFPATQYFFEKLTFAEREESLLRTARDVIQQRVATEWCPYHEALGLSDVLCFLFSVMPADQVKEVLKEKPCKTLQCFFYWPRQDLSGRVAEWALPHAEERDFGGLLFVLARRHSFIYNFEKVFRDIFRVTPSNLRNYIASMFQLYVQDLLNFEDTITIKFLLRTLNASELNQLVSGDVAELRCHKTKDDKWDFFARFVNDARLSREEKMKFASFFISHFDSLMDLESRQRFLKFVEDLVPVVSERNQVDESHSAEESDEALKKRLVKKRKRTRRGRSKRH